MARSHLSVGEEFTGFARWVPGPSGGAWWSESRSFQGIIPHHAPPWLSSAGGAGDREGDPGHPALRPSLTPWGREGTACLGCVMGRGSEEAGAGENEEEMSGDSEPGDTGPAPGLELGRGGGERQTGWRVEGLSTGLGSWRRRPVSISISVLWAWVPPLLPWEGVAKPHGKAGSLLRPTPPIGERGGRPHWNGQEPELAGPRSRSRKGWL